MQLDSNGSYDLGVTRTRGPVLCVELSDSLNSLKHLQW